MVPGVTPKRWRKKSLSAAGAARAAGAVEVGVCIGGKPCGHSLAPNSTTPKVKPLLKFVFKCVRVGRCVRGGGVMWVCVRARAPEGIGHKGVTVPPEFLQNDLSDHHKPSWCLKHKWGKVRTTR